MPRRTTRWRATELTVARAQALRREMTPAEKRLWECVRGDRLDGLRIRRQHALGHYIVDFYHAPSLTVIEIDGDVHAEPGASERDQERERWLVESGHRVIRFTNEDVFKRLDGVLETIRLVCRGEL